MSNYSSSFNGSVSQQVMAGSYPQHRGELESLLKRSVEKKHLTAEEADTRLTDADALWAKNARRFAIAKKK